MNITKGKHSDAFKREWKEEEYILEVKKNEGQSQVAEQEKLSNFGFNFCSQWTNLFILKQTTNTTATPGGTHYLQDQCFWTAVLVPSPGVQTRSCSVSVQSPRPCSPPAAPQFSSCLCPGPVQDTHEPKCDLWDCRLSCCKHSVCWG